MKPFDSGERWTLYSGDLFDVLPQLGVCANGIVSDPPYATAGGNTSGRDSATDTQFWSYWFRGAWERISACLDGRSCGFLFSDWRMIAALHGSIAGGIDRQTASAWRQSQALVWDRESIGLGSPFRAGFEMIGFIRGPDWKHDPEIIPRTLPAVIRHRWPYGSHAHHGAEKPADLCAQLVKWTGATRVLDPFCGSGSTGVGALREGRRFIGIEREPAYLEIAARRLAQAESDGVQEGLFA